MLRLDGPKHSFEQSIDDCIAGIAPHVALFPKMSDGKPALLLAGEEYVRKARNATLSDIAAFIGPSDDVVLAGLTKSELLKVYVQYFAADGKAARKMYDEIMASANDKCPFCGGIGTPRNLDHFLAKAYFPQYAFLPANLVPACRDCNMDGKGHQVAASVEHQPLQPYFDASIYFDDQWIHATYEEDPAPGVGRIRYFVSTPADWPGVAKRRALNHFVCFDLAKRYSVKAAEHVGTIRAQIQRMLERGLDSADVRKILVEPGMAGAPFVNHWQRGMYEALGAIV